MTNAAQLISDIHNGKYDSAFLSLYGETTRAKSRYITLLEGFAKHFGEERGVLLISSPGRTEIGGNHTDHNHGCVLVGAVQLDIIAAVSPNHENMCHVVSAEFGAEEISLETLSPVVEEKFTSKALIRGVARGFSDSGFAIGGFDAFTMTDVLKGSGISSSAAYELLIAGCFCALYNDDSIDKVKQAKIAKFAENVFFGKPSGLMDQLAIAIGGLTKIDFNDTENPVIQPVQFDFASAGHALCIVDTGGSHADLSCEYGAIVEEMHAIAGEFGQTLLRQVDKTAFYSNISGLRAKYGDRAVLRAIHYFADSERTGKMKAALENNNLNEFFELVNASGNSSFCFLQNAYPLSTPAEQGVSLGLALTKNFLGNKGACRLHGGGFGGTIQAYVPDEMVSDYKQMIENVFGSGSCYIMKIRTSGSCVVKPQE